MAPAIKIVYPIQGETYPKCDPLVKVKSAYFTASFSMTKSGGAHTVKWWFDNAKRALGSATFYDEISCQFTFKLPAGIHVFHVKSGAEEATTKFRIG
jgi:hypothetical protein